MNLILIPVYNDWKSLNKLLSLINKKTKKKNSTQLLIIDDHSSKKMTFQTKKFYNIKKIDVLRLNENIGSQKAIAVGLKYLNQSRKRDYNYISIMDGDGEDNPENLNSMLNIAKNNKNSVIVSCRKDRNENLLIKLGYKIHLILTFLFTFNWMSFGNFSCFYYKNLKKIFTNRSAWHAYSASIKKNTRIKRVYAVRSKRFYGNSKVNLKFLISHSLRIIGVFYIRVFLLSVFYMYIISNIFHKNLYFLNILIIIFNFFILSSIFTNDLKENTFFKRIRIK